MRCPSQRQTAIRIFLEMATPLGGFAIHQLDWSEAFATTGKIVPNLKKIRRENLIQQAEGYLDLVLCLEDRWSLPQPLVDRISGKALETLDRVDAQTGRRSHIELLRGQAFRLQNRYREALEAYRQSLATDSENVHALVGSAWCHKRLGDLQAAIDDLEQALQLQPRQPLILYNLACYWSLLGNVDRCCDCMQQALDLDDRLRVYVDNESDFDPVRDDPRFQSCCSALA